MATPTRLPGLDVASYQGYPDWGAVAVNGHAFAITKATEATSYRNPTFAHNWHGIQVAGMVRGAYHFARPSENTPDAEAEHFISTLESEGGLEPGDLLALDMEDEQYHGGGPYASAANWSLGFLEYLEAYYGFKPFLYTGAWYLQRPGWGAAQDKLGTYGLWLAAYQSQPPPAPAPWPFVAIWQYSSSGYVPGISGNVDLNWFHGSREQLLAYGLPGETPPPPDPEPEPDPCAELRAEIAALKVQIEAKDAMLSRWVESAARAISILEWEDE
jgi:GH25 family lysozyme M1 (1,4-beta-N-acetylmuramidase)